MEEEEAVNPKRSEGTEVAELVLRLRGLRDALRAAGTKREIPGRTAARQRARAHLRRASRWVTAALRALEEGSRR